MRVVVAFECTTREIRDAMARMREADAEMSAIYRRVRRMLDEAGS